MVRRIASAVAGIFAGTFVILLVEMIGQSLFPLPLGTNPNAPESLRAAMAEIPVAAFLAVLLAWSAGGFVGCWLARRIGETRAPAITTMVVLLLASVYNLITIPSPVWFWVLGLLAFPVFGLAGVRLAERSQPDPQGV